jgi:membrane-bound lytic murein transglycosylase F
MQTYAERYDFDWRLIAAQMYQESQFDPRAVSTAGATGLMQMLPDTAKSLGFLNLTDPRSSIHAGIKYLDRLRNEFDKGVPASERTWFALAAYNTGFGRVENARHLAAKMGLDPNRWFGNVETAMLHYARPNNGAKPDRRYGQAIIYVRQIQSLYGTYRRVSLAATPELDPRISALPLSAAGTFLGVYSFAAAP